MMELGIFTYGNMVADPHTGHIISQSERMHQMIELARLADEAGLDLIGVGEHHDPSFITSATATVLAAMAAVTKRIRLTSALTILGLADPVRTFEEFATADLVSAGRVEIILGRGANVGNYSLFGYDFKDNDALFAEKLDLFARLNEDTRVSWSGTFRTPLTDVELAPRPAQKRLPVWVGAGSPGSLTRAATLGYPLALPMLSQPLESYYKAADIYREAWVNSGRRIEDVKIAAFSHLHVSETARQTREEFYPYYSAYMSPIRKKLLTREDFDQLLSPQGAVIGGSPQAVIDKIMTQHQAMGLTRYLGQMDMGGQSFSQIAKTLELFATKVVPVIKKSVA